MMINKIHIMSSVVAMTVIIAALWYWMMLVECVSEIQVSIGDENAEVSTS
jgi:hypothetical protein